VLLLLLLLLMLLESALLLSAANGLGDSKLKTDYVLPLACLLAIAGWLADWMDDRRYKTSRLSRKPLEM